MPDIENRNQETIDSLYEALTTHGFFTITDHGIKDEVLASSYKVSKEFFDLSEIIKNKYDESYTHLTLPTHPDV